MVWRWMWEKGWRGWRGQRKRWCWDMCRPWGRKASGCQKKLLRGLTATMVVFRNPPSSVQTTLYYLRAVLNAARGYQGMHLPYWRGQLEEVEGEVRRLIRGYEGIPTGVPWCVLRSPTAHFAEGMPTAGEAYRIHTARTLNRMCDNQEEVVR